MKNGSKQRRITITYDPDKGIVKTNFIPRLKQGDMELKNNHLNGLINGTSNALNILLYDLPMLREPTQDEIDAHVYIFKDQVKDNALYKARKVLHHDIVKAFNDVLSEHFADIIFVDSSFADQQEMSLNMTPEEAEAHKAKIMELAKKVIGDSPFDSPEPRIQGGSELIKESVKHERDDDGGFDPHIG